MDIPRYEIYGLLEVWRSAGIRSEHWNPIKYNQLREDIRDKLSVNNIHSMHQPLRS